MNSLGFMEVQSVTGAIEALDIMCKAADVKFVTWEKRLGGRLVTLIVQGEVSAVSEALKAAAASIRKQPCIHFVIANPHEETWRMVKASAERLKR